MTELLMVVAAFGPVLFVFGAVWLSIEGPPRWWLDRKARRTCEGCRGVALFLLTGAAAQPALNRFGDGVVNAGGLCPRHTERADHIEALERELLP